MISGVAALIVHHFGAAADIAQAIATAVIFAIITAAKNAFCKMTKIELAAALKQ